MKSVRSRAASPRPTVSRKEQALPAPQSAARTASLNEKSIGQSASPRYAVHVASYKVRVSAENAVKAYRKRGHTARLARVDLPARGIFYRVLVGAYRNRGEATRSAVELRSGKRTRYAAVVDLPSAAPGATQPDASSHPAQTLAKR